MTFDVESQLSAIRDIARIQIIDSLITSLKLRLKIVFVGKK